LEFFDLAIGNDSSIELSTVRVTLSILIPSLNLHCLKLSFISI
jgi:hypothetical protein